MKLLVGLGNPGEKYARNRHNIGFIAVDKIAREYGFEAWRSKFQGLVAEGRIGTQKCLLLKPKTYMNESGRSAGEASNFYKLEADDVIVFHDELDLAPGKLRVKIGGGTAGHNGLRSISASPIGNDYVRVRIGIGHPGNKNAVSGYVLRDFTKADQEWIPDLLDGIVKGLPDLIDGEHQKFMSTVGNATAEIRKSEDPRAPAKSSAQPKPKKDETKSTQPAGTAFADKLKSLFGRDNNQD